MLRRKKIRTEEAQQAKQAAFLERFKPSSHLSEADIEQVRHEGAPDGWVWRLPWEPTLADKHAAEQVGALKGVVRER